MARGPDAIAYQTTARRVFANQLQIEAEGGAWLVYQFSEPGMPLRSLGVFHTSFPADDPELRSIFDFAETEGLLQMAPGEGPHRGPPPKNILINKGSVTKTFFSDVAGVFKRPFSDLESRLEQIIPRIAKHAVAGLTIGMAVSQQEVRPGQSCNVRFEFRNTGPSDIKFANPRCETDETVGEIILEFYQPGPAPDRTGDLALSLSTHDHELLTAPRQAVSSSQALLELPASQTLGFSLDFILPNLQPGNYTVKANYTSNADPPVKSLVTGVYCPDSLSLRVLPGVQGT